MDGELTLSGGMRPMMRPTVSPDSMIASFGPTIQEQILALQQPAKMLMEEPVRVVDVEASGIIERFQEEVRLSRDHYRSRRERWEKVRSYMNAEDPAEIPPGYTESTFFYRRLPRIVETGKSRLMKHVAPIHATVWGLNATAQDSGADGVKEKIETLKRRMKDDYEIIGEEDLVDESGDLVMRYGSAIWIGPFHFSAPRSRWQGGTLRVVEEDMNRPMWEVWSPFNIYPDAHARKQADLEQIHIYDPMTENQLWQLADSGDLDREAVEALLDDMPDGNFAMCKESWDTRPDDSRLWVVWRRFGLVTEEVTGYVKRKKLDAEPKEMLADDGKPILGGRQMWDTWYCGDQFILKCKRRVFRPDTIPAYFVPFRRDPDSVFGIGVGEACLEVQEMLVNIARSLDDALLDTSGYQVAIDAAAVTNTDLKVRPRKTWTWRRKAKDAHMSGQRAVDFFAVPSNIPHLLQAFSLFESLIPVVSGVPETPTGQVLGSGIRTDNMLNATYEVIEEFIKTGVGNFDRFLFKPRTRDHYDWIRSVEPENDDYNVDIAVVTTGVKGALKRELVGRKLKEMAQDLNLLGFSDWIDPIEGARTVIEGVGMDGERAVLTVEAYLAKKQAEIAEKQAETQATRGVEHSLNAKERAHTSARDAILQGFKATRPDNPLWPLFAEQLFELTGLSNPKVNAAIGVWMQALIAYYQKLGIASQEQVATLMEPPRSESVLEVEPGFRDEAQAEMAKQEDTRTSPAEPAPVLNTLMGGVASGQQADVLGMLAGDMGGAAPPQMPDELMGLTDGGQA